MHNFFAYTRRLRADVNNVTAMQVLLRVALIELTLICIRVCYVVFVEFTIYMHIDSTARRTEEWWRVLYNWIKELCFLFRHRRSCAGRVVVLSASIFIWRKTQASFKFAFVLCTRSLGCPMELRMRTAKYFEIVFVAIRRLKMAYCRIARRSIYM